MHPSVYWSTVYNSLDMEATLMPINRRMGKEDVVHIYNGIVLRREKNEIMPFAATQMDLEIIKLNKSEEDKYHMVSLICEI